LEVLADENGSVAIGWAAERVLYARFKQNFSGNLGDRYAACLETLIRPVESLHYFADASSLHGCDLLARSTFARVVFANRRRFGSIVVLTWGEGVGLAARALTEALGDSVEFVTDNTAFETRLLALAPQARRTLGSEWPRPPTSNAPLR
jgi:hypothetical protein